MKSIILFIFLIKINLNIFSMLRDFRTILLSSFLLFRRWIMPNGKSLFIFKSMVAILLLFVTSTFFYTESSYASIPPQPLSPLSSEMQLRQRIKKDSAHQVSLIFDLPVTYNSRVTKWVSFFQKKGHRWFRTWLERSTLYMPKLQTELQKAGLPQDLAFMVMIESGFSPHAKSHANAVGPWQFIKPTGERYGLKINSWLDERRDWQKSTQAAVRYLSDLHREFGSWYLVAASYNMGENGLRRQIQKHQTRDFWKLAELKALPQETIDYVPKILAAMMISKAPSLYGFRDIPIHNPFDYDTLTVRGNIHLDTLADSLGVTPKTLYDLNAELINKSIPSHVVSHALRIPRGGSYRLAQYVANNEDKRID